MISPQQPDENKPLQELDEWEDDLLRRYPEPGEASRFTDPNKKEEEFFEDGKILEPTCQMVPNFANITQVLTILIILMNFTCL